MHEAELKEHGEEAIWLRRQLGPASSFTKLGGLPGLPSNIEWPRQTQSGTSLHFLAQIDLSILPPTPLNSNGPALPASGFLFFFADMVEEMLWNDNGGPFATTRVIFSDQDGAERAPPDDIPDILHEFGQRQGGYRTGIAVYPSVSLLPHVFRTFNYVSPWPVASDTYSLAAQTAMAASIEKALGAPIPTIDGPNSWQIIQDTSPSEYRQDERLYLNRHQMLGVGKDVQGTAEAARENGDILLLQIDSDKAIHRHFVFCDMGVAQFWIKPEDLASKRFHKAWATTEG